MERAAMRSVNMLRKMENTSASLSAARRVAVVVGACGGIGSAIAHVLATEGYRLVLLDARGTNDLKRLAESVDAEGDTSVFPCSITDPTQLDTVITELANSVSQIDALVNAAGVFHYGSAAETTTDIWRKVIDVNLSGMFFVIRAFLPLLRRAPYARIVNVLSVAAKNAFPNQTAYCASKWGGLGLTRALAEELRSERIYLTALCPGAVNTPLWSDPEAPAFDRTKMLHDVDIANSIAYILRQRDHVSIDEIVLTPSAGLL
jgi:NAD(P)-dependent dehydrogenase (short-subunit alcohol dehydrogenase family)